MDSLESPHTKKEISCRITRTLLMYVKEVNSGSLGSLLDGLSLDEIYLSDTNNWVSHAFLQVLYHRMVELLGDENSVYQMALASERFESFGILDRIVRLMGTPKMIYSQGAKYTKLLRSIGEVVVHDSGDSWILIEDRYHISAQKTRYDCDYARGILVGLPTMFGLPAADIEEIQCQVAPSAYGTRIWPDNPKQGYPGCMYRVSWSQQKKISFWKGFFSRHHVYNQAIADLMLANQSIQEKYEEARQLALRLGTANRELIASKLELVTKQAELSASENRYRFLAEKVTDIIWILRLDTLTFDYVSPSVQKIRGFTPEEAMALELTQTLSPKSLDMVGRLLEQELAADTVPGSDPNRSRALELENSCKNGGYVWVEATVCFIRDPEGRPTGILGVTRDISERKAAEQKAADLTAQLHRAQNMEALGNLAAGVAHDLNNLLSGMVSMPEIILLELPQDSPLRKMVSIIQQSGEKAATIVQDLLTLARRNVTTIKTIRLNQIIDEYLASPEYQALMNHHPTVRIGSDLSADLLNIKGSAVHFLKMIMNLVSNSAEAMPTGGRITLNTRNIYLDQARSGYELIPAGEYVVLTVTDEGVGIAVDALKRIFDPFFTKKKMGRSGSGLGMTIVWATVKDYGGYVDLESTEGVGTWFTFYFPITREGHPEAIERVVMDDYLGNETILIIDDMEDQRYIATQMLSKLGYTVKSAASGEEAVAWLRTNQVDLLILDMIMDPGIDGLETYRLIITHRPGQKAIVVSGYAESDRVQELLRLGAGSYLRKPYSMEKLGLAVRRELDRKKGPD